MKFETKLIQANRNFKDVHKSLQIPIYQSSTFIFNNVDEGVRRFSGDEDGYIYTRLGNPTQSALENIMAKLEEGEDALALSSGMAAISGAVLSFLEAGDHLIAPHSLYGSTHSFFSEVLPKWDIDISFVDMRNLNNLNNNIQDNTKIIFTETPSNPVLSLIDLKGVAEIARANDLITITDNTFMSPYLQKPLNFNIDLVIHSATKYIGGHGDTIAGLIIGNKKLMTEIKSFVLKNLGGIIAPFDAFLLLRGIKTLAVRMDRINNNAIKIAKFLKEHPAVKTVHYPGLAEHPQHELAKKQMKGFGGVISFDLKGGLEAGKQLMNILNVCTLAVSLGDVDTLIQHPASMSHSGVKRELRLAEGISDGLVRLSVGIEAIEDLIADLKQGLDKVL